MIFLIPIGDVTSALLEILVVPLKNVFNQIIKIESSRELPPESWNSKRNQYLADTILNGIPDPQPGDRSLGIVDVDLYALGLNYVFGEADLKSRKAVISLIRLRQEYYSLSVDNNLFQERMIKEAVHEIGHTYGIKHCPNSRCVMHFSNSLQDTDIKKGTFCPICQRTFNRAD